MSGPIRIFRAPSNDHAAATRSDDLVAVEGEYAEIAECAREPTRIGPLGVLRSKRLRGILDHPQVETPCHIINGHHIRHIAEHVDDDNCLDGAPCLPVAQHPFRERALLLAIPLELYRVEAERVVAIHENRMRADVLNRIDSGDEGQCRNEDRIIRLDTGQEQSDVKPRRPRLACNRPRSAHETRYALLERGNVRPRRRYPTRAQSVSHILDFPALDIRNREGDPFSRHN